MILWVMENEEAVLLRKLVGSWMQKVHFHETSRAGSIYLFYIYSRGQLNIISWFL